MRRIAILVILLVVAGIATVAMASGRSEAARAHGARNIALSPVAGPPFDTARGRAVVQVDTDHPKSGTWAYVQYMVNGFPPQFGRNSYALYATTPSIGRIRVMTFNTRQDMRHQDFAELTHITGWLTDDVFMEVYLEVDDGFDAPDLGAV
jgi:hypothetical protein